MKKRIQHTGYKVVADTDGKLTSVYCPKPLTYVLGRTKRTSKNFGPMGVFTNSLSALHFLNTQAGLQRHRLSSLRIYRCQYTRSVERGFWYWSKPDKMFVHNFGVYEVPFDTDFAQSVKLLEEVKL